MMRIYFISLILKSEIWSVRNMFEDQVEPIEIFDGDLNSKRWQEKWLETG